MTPRDLIAGIWLATLPVWLGGMDSPSARLPEAPSDATASRGYPAALLDASDEELARRIGEDPKAVGSLSIGAPGSSILYNAVALQPDARWTIPPSAAVWGTSETIAAIETVIAKVHELYPDSPPLVVGDISSADGGRLKRHESHQGGRDVDFGFYHRGGGVGSFIAGTAANLDLPRNWALVRAMVLYTDVEAIFLDTRVQRLLYRHALSVGEDKAWLDRVFQFVKWSPGAVIKHVPRHRNHYHVRFYNPVAQELGRRAHPILVQLNIIEPPVFTIKHVVRPGQTMGHLAARYGTSVRAIQRANGMHSTVLRAGRAYRIPRRAAAPPVEPVVVPPRPLPPQTPTALAAVEWPTAPPWSAELADPAAWSPGVWTLAFRRY